MVEFTVILSSNQSKLMSTINQFLLRSINFPIWMSFGQSYSICSTHFNVASPFLACSCSWRSKGFNFDCSVAPSRRGKLMNAVTYIALQSG